jgi:hypothetical protein
MSSDAVGLAGVGTKVGSGSSVGSGGMRLIYIDDSGKKRQAAYDQLVEYRHGLRASDGILARKELHAFKTSKGVQCR